MIYFIKYLHTYCIYLKT